MSCVSQCNRFTLRCIESSVTLPMVAPWEPPAKVFSTKFAMPHAPTLYMYMNDVAFHESFLCKILTYHWSAKVSSLNVSFYTVHTHSLTLIYAYLQISSQPMCLWRRRLWWNSVTLVWAGSSAQRQQLNTPSVWPLLYNSIHLGGGGGGWNLHPLKLG